MTRNDVEPLAGEIIANLAAVTAEVIATSSELVRQATEAVAEVRELCERRAVRR